MNYKIPGEKPTTTNDNESENPSLLVSKLKNHIL